MKKLFMIVMALAAGMAAWGDEGAFAHATGAPMRVDSRTGTRIAAKGASETIAYSPKWVGASSCTVTADGTMLKTTSDEGEVMWTPTTTGAHVLTHTAGDVTYTVQFAVLGDDVIQHIGTLTGNETWSSNRVHLVTGAVTVPSGKTLTIEPGTVVKFMSGTSLTANGTCTAKGVIFTHVNDDTVGGDTLMDGDEAKPVVGAYRIDGDISDDGATEYRYPEPQTLTETISSNTRLRGHMVYLAHSSITVDSGVTLTLAPGTIIKFASGCSMTVNGTLEAQGTRAEPIVFTSLKDDDWGGDTNGDGENTRPGYGDWNQIRVSGTAKFNYANVFYNSATENYGGIEAYGGTVTFDNSVIAHTKYECVNAHSSGRFSACNSVFWDASLGFGYYGGSRVRAVNCVFAEMTTAIRQSDKQLTNCIFYRCQAFTDQSGDSSSFSHCLFWNPVGEGAQRYAKTGKDGNVWADPGFIDPDNGDFRLTAKSPCIDAGAGMEAPEYDFYGVRRVTVRTDGAPGSVCSNGAYPDIGIAEYVPSDADSDYDLMPTALSASVSEIHPGENLKLSWTILNKGTADITDGWHDALYLVSATGREILLGENTTTQPLVSGMTCSCAAEFAVPAMTEGDWYPKLVVNSRRSDVPEGTNSANNVFVASAPVAVVIPAYEYSEGTRGTLSSTGVTVLRFTFEEGTMGQIARVKVPVGTKVTYGLGFVPQGESASGSLTASERGDVLFHVPVGTREAYVTLSEDVGGGEYDIAFEEGDIAVSYITPESVPCSGAAAVSIFGAGFSDDTTVAFQGAGQVVPVNEVKLVSSSELAVILDCAQFAAEESVRAIVAGKTYAGAELRINPLPASPDIWARLVVPDEVRDGRVMMCYAEFGNRGTASGRLPVLEIAVSGTAGLRYVGTSDNSDHKRIWFFGAGDRYPYYLLAPGETHRVAFGLKVGDTNEISLRVGDLEEMSLDTPALPMLEESICRIGCLGGDVTCFSAVCEFANSVANGTIHSAAGGHVLNADLLPVRDVTVIFTCLDQALSNTVSAISDANGHFIATGLVPGEYAISVAGAALAQEVQSISVENGGDVVDLLVSVNDSDSFSICPTGDDAEEVSSVTAVKVGTNAVHSATLKDGLWLFRGLDNGTYSVRVESNSGGVGELTVRLPLHRTKTLPCAVCAPGSIVGRFEGLGARESAIAILFSRTGDIYPYSMDETGEFEIDGIPVGEYALLVYSDETVNTPFFTNLVISSGSSLPVTCGKSAMAARESVPKVAKAILLSQSTNEDVEWTERMWNINALSEGKKFLRTNRNNYSSLNNLVSLHMTLLDSPGGCTSPAKDNWGRDAKAALQNYNKALAELQQAIKAAEAGVDSQLLANAWEALKNFGTAMERMAEFRIGKTNKDLADTMRDASDFYGTLVNFAEQLHDTDGNVFQSAALTYANTDEILINIKNLNKGLDDFSNSEWSLTDTTKIKATLQVVGNGVGAYFNLVEIAKHIEKTGVGNEALRAAASAIVLSEKSMGRYSALLESIGSSCDFILNLEAIGTDSTLAKWGLLRDAIRKSMANVIRCRDKMEKIWRAAPSVPDCVGCGSESNCDKPLEPTKEKDKKRPRKDLSWDPNEISGPLGVGDARYVKPGDWMTYTVYFENLSNATASAAEVYVKNPLSKWLDWSTFEMGEVAFNNQSDLGLVGLQSGISEVVMSGESYFVRSQVDLDETTGEVNWYLRAYDKTTPDTWPEDIAAGLLPPNDETHRGEGHLTYRIKVREDAPRNAIIENSAEIVFDYNPVIPTNPNWWNTVGSSSAEVGFSTSEITVDEGSVIEFAVSGGNAEKASSVGVYLTCLTAAAADLDLAKGSIDGVVPKGGIKFPLTLSWAAGEVTNRVIRIPVKTDKTVEGDERLVFQLAAAQGMVVGDVSLCDVTLNDATEAATLQDGAMSQAVKLSSKPTKDAPAWLAGRGNVSDPDGTLGLYHAESPTLALGVSSELTAAVTRSYDLHFKLRFSGPAEEETPSTLAVYDGKRLLGVIGHGVVSQADWEFSVSNEWDSIDISLGGGNATIRLVLTQGSDPAVHAELSDFWCDQGLGRTLYRVKALNAAPAGGYVTGSGLYVDGSTASLKAKANPGWVFRHWLLMDDDESTSVWSVKETVSLKVTDAIRVTAVFEPVPFVLGLADPADGGKISGSGYCAEGKKVTLKATANKNFAFTGWYTNDVLVSGLPTLVVDRSAKPAAPSKTQDVITNITENVTYYAAFKSDPEVFVYAAATDGKGDALTGTGAGKFVAGTVTGMGKYAADKKVTLKATANKGYVFAGWWPDVQTAGEPLSKAASYVIEKMPTNDVELVAAFVTAEEDKASIEASVDGFALEPWVSKDETRALTTNVWAGVSLEWSVAARALSETTVAVSGLPSGLKFAAKPVTSKVGSGKTAVTVTNVAANTIYGAPSAASKTTKAKDGSVTVVPTAVKVTVTTAGKNKQTYQIDMTVDPLPAWAVGTFAGPSYDGDDTNGVASVTVATSGKITAKQPVAGKATSFSATCFDRYDAEADAYVATLTAKVGTNVVTNVMAVTAAESGTGFVEADLFDAWQHNWKVEPWKEVGKSFDKREVSYEEEGVRVTLKFSASGTAKVAGEFAKLDDEGNYVYNKYGVLQTVTATGSATLLPTLGEGGETRYIAFVYLAPKDLPAHARCVEVAAEVVE